MILTVENVYTGYNKRPVLYNISFEINKGEIILLIGPNGSGKSTLLKYLYNLLQPFKNGTGIVIFDDNIITGMKPSELLHKGLVYIPQKDNVFLNLTAHENLEIAGIAIQNKKLFEKRFLEILDLFPVLKDLLKREAMKLSGGEKQLLSFAMAMLYTPKLILVDEPFAGLSHKNIEIVKNKIQKLNKEFNITFLIVEHKIKESYNIAQKIIGLKMGKIDKILEINSNFKIEELNSIFLNN